MEMEGVLLAAIQSSFLLGLLHGVNPCGHSWLVLAPFVSGEREGRRVATLTTAFLLGTAMACLALGASLGAISGLMPDSAGAWVEGGTSLILILIGALLIYNPHLLHSHDHASENVAHDHGLHGHCHGCSETGKRGWADHFLQRSGRNNFLPLALFIIGFVNMIVPCPTAAVMYGYALNSGSSLAATLVFGIYAISTAIAVGAVIYLIFKATSMASKLQKDWVEPLIMRLAGGVIIIFSSYSLYGISTG
jgi:nickel/cobalt exporter